MLKFLQMGGYALYVWPAYALTLLVIALNIGWARRCLRSAQMQARRRLAQLRPLEPHPARERELATHPGSDDAMPPRDPTRAPRRS